MSKILLIMLLISFSLLQGIPGYTQQNSRQAHEQIVEEVKITNVELAVRVFQRKKLVPGLKKKDFKLFVNGKEKEINGFFENQKKLDAVANSPRYFLLIVNICDYHLDMKNALDPLFDNIIKPNDHVTLVSNNFFIEDRHIPNPRDEKEKIKGILQIEASKIEYKLRILEQRMKSLLRLFKSRQQAGNMDSMNAQDFVMDYVQLVQEFKDLYLDLGTDKYIRLAQHLKDQPGEKWVLGFYQVGRFFKPKFGSSFFKAVLGTEETSNQTFDSFESLRWYEKLRSAVEPAEVLPQEDLVKTFINTGATFHTILLEYGKTMQNELAADLSYVPIISDSYYLLKEISTRTGGTFMDTNKFDRFFEKIATNNDVYYVLTFAPDENETGIENNIKIKINDNTKRYRISYSNLQQGKYFEKAMKKVQKETPRIRIGLVDFKDNRLSFVVSNFKIKQSEPSNSSELIKLPVRIQVLNQQSQSLFDGVKMFELNKKEFQGKKAKAILQVDFPKLPPGVYNVFIRVGDPSTGERDLAFKAITIPGATDS